MPTPASFVEDQTLAPNPSGAGRGGRPAPKSFVPDPSDTPATSQDHSWEDAAWNFGWPNIVNGIGQALKSGQRMVGLHKAFTGATQVAAPFAIPALVAAPLATIGTLAAGTAGGTVGKVGSELMGASPEAADLIGDAGSLLGGGLASSPKVQAFTRGAVKAIPGAVSDNGSPNLLNILKGKTSLPATIGAMLGHFVGHPYEGAAAGTAIGAVPSMVSGGSTAAEYAPWLPDIFKSPVVRPPAARFEPSPQTLPDLSPIPATETPSGRKPGGIANQQPMSPVVRQSAATELSGIDPNDLDAAASLLTNNKKTFTDLKGEQRQTAINQARGFSQQRVALSTKPSYTPPGTAGVLAPDVTPVATLPDIGAPTPQAAGSAPIQPVGNNINYPDAVHPQLHAAGPEVAITHGTNASAKDLAVAARLKNLNITPEAMDAMPDTELNKHYTDLGYKKLGSDYAPGKRVGRDAATGRAHLRNVLDGLWK